LVCYSLESARAIYRWTELILSGDTHRPCEGDNRGVAFRETVEVAHSVVVCFAP
jgi:hypothetical protein